MISQQYTYAYAAVTAATGELDTLILPRVNTYCMQLFINEVAARHPKDRIVMVMDGAGWHKGLTEPPNLRVVKQPPYSPELNPVEFHFSIKTRTILGSPGVSPAQERPR